MKIPILNLFFLINIISFQTYSQNISLSGKIKDQNTRREIAFASIIIKGTEKGTTADFAGKFTIQIPKPIEDKVLIVQHVSYEKAEILVTDFLKNGDIFLQPKVIPLKDIEVTAKREQTSVEKEIPQTVSVLDAASFDLKGFTDAGDLLRIDHSVQVDEELSGKKTISIRGGNADEVIVMYNGVKMNSAYDNTFDLSLIDLDNIDKFEIIKGSNTALYGSEAFSGVINIVPKTKQDYTVRFQQRIGTYGSGNWGLGLFQSYENLSGAYSIRQGGSKRKFADTPGKYLVNESIHHSANLVYDFSDGNNQNTLGLMFVKTDLAYQNQRDYEKLTNQNQLISSRYEGSLFGIQGFDLSASIKSLGERQKTTLDTNYIDKNISDQAVVLNLQKQFFVQELEFIIGYQMEKSDLKYRDERQVNGEQSEGLESGLFQRQHHGLVSVAKIHNPLESEFFQTMDFDISFRSDNIKDSPSDLIFRSNSTNNNLVNGKNWSENMFKFSTFISGSNEKLAVNLFANFGKSVKFPTLFQQLSVPIKNLDQGAVAELNPEKNQALDINFTVLREFNNVNGIYGVQVSATYLANTYENKFRTSYSTGIPTPFFDNVLNATLSGFEIKSTVFLWAKKVSVDGGFSKYFISDKSAFPFKSDSKITVGGTFDYDGYSASILWYNESEQIGWVRKKNGQLAEIELPSNKNVDLHVSKSLEFYGFKVFGNFSIRNLLTDNSTLEGLAWRDRRMYLTFGAQY